MPCGYHINLADGLLTIQASSQVTLAELITLGESILVDPAFDPQLPQLVDLRNAEVVGIEKAASNLRQFALHTYQQQMHASIAIVVNSNLSERAVAGLYHLACAMDKTELFDHYEQALKWLMRREFA